MFSSRNKTAALVIFGIIACSTWSQSQSPNLETTCATQARKAFTDWQSKFKSDPASKVSKTISSNHRSHHNTKLNKCLVFLETIRKSSHESIISLFLTDAFEGRIYATYIWNSGGTDLPVPPSTCELTPSLWEKKVCSSRVEFDAFVADYMAE
jgi:hypothetical protein